MSWCFTRQVALGTIGSSFEKRRGDEVTICEGCCTGPSWPLDFIGRRIVTCCATNRPILNALGIVILAGIAYAVGQSSAVGEVGRARSGRRGDRGQAAWGVVCVYHVYGWAG